MTKEYLITLFKGGKCQNLFYSDTLDDLVTINAMYRDCEISIFAFRQFCFLPDKVVKEEIRKSSERWRRAVEEQRRKAQEEAERPKKVQRKRRPPKKKYWIRPVLCVETGQVFKSITECRERVGLPYKAVWNSLTGGYSRKGLHFIYAPDYIVEHMEEIESTVEENNQEEEIGNE